MAELQRPICPITSGPDHPVGCRRAWASGLIVALFVALASALLPGAIPASQMVGSAFNPATTQVALNRDESAQASISVLLERGQRAATTGGDRGLTILPSTPLGIAGQPYVLTPGLAPNQTQLARHTFVRAGSGPRAPPATA